MSILVLLAAFGVTLFANEKIIVAAFEYPPIYQDEAEKGLSGDLVVAAFKAVNIDVDLEFFPVARMVYAVADGQAVCGIGGALLFEARDVAQAVTVSTIVNYVTQVFMYDSRKFPAGFSFKRLDDMAKYSIGVLNASGIMKFLEKDKNLKLEPNSGHESTAKQLHLGRIDAWAIVDLTGMMYMKKLFPAEAGNYKYTRYFNRGDVSLVFSKKMDPDNKYNAKFKEGLAIIKKDGTYMKIVAKYYGGRDSINREALADDMK